MSKSQDWDREKKIRRPEKSVNKAVKHRGSIYDMLYDEDDDVFDQTQDSTFVSNSNYTKVK